MMIDIALGLFSDGRDADLAAFAREVDASYMSQWRDMELFDDDVEGWGQAFEQVVTRTLARGGRIHFNLTGLNIGEALGGDPDVWVELVTRPGNCSRSFASATGLRVRSFIAMA
jgi:hypothetical protein